MIFKKYLVYKVVIFATYACKSLIITIDDLLRGKVRSINERLINNRKSVYSNRLRGFFMINDLLYYKYDEIAVDYDMHLIYVDCKMTTRL